MFLKINIYKYRHVVYDICKNVRENQQLLIAYDFIGI